MMLRIVANKAMVPSVMISATASRIDTFDYRRDMDVLRVCAAGITFSMR